jgi:TonB family protein
MKPGNTLFRCLGLSTLLHVGLLAGFPSHILKSPLANRPIEIAYQASVGSQGRLPADSPAPTASRPKTAPVNTPVEKEPFWKDTASTRDLIQKDLFKKAALPDIANRPLLSDKDIDAKKSVYMPSIPGETFKTPEYRSYYQVIREEIRRYAYLNYKKLEQGEVYLTFTLLPDGTVETAAVNRDKSSKNEYLCDIAFNSVQEAAPYPPFPDKLKNHPKLSFNVIIAFELK